jgi:hypothetical protein
MPWGPFAIFLDNGANWYGLRETSQQRRASDPRKRPLNGSVRRVIRAAHLDLLVNLDVDDLEKAVRFYGLRIIYFYIRSRQHAQAYNEPQLPYSSPLHNHAQGISAFAGFPRWSQSVRTDKPADMTASFGKFIFHSFKKSGGGRCLAPGKRRRVRTVTGNHV